MRVCVCVWWVCVGEGGVSGREKVSGVLESRGGLFWTVDGLRRVSMAVLGHLLKSLTLTE